MKGLGVIIQDSYFKAAFQFCEGNLSVMLLGEVVAEQLSQPRSLQLPGRWQPRLSGTGMLQAVGEAPLQGMGVGVQGALQTQGSGGIPPPGTCLGTRECTQAPCRYHCQVAPVFTGVSRCFEL